MKLARVVLKAPYKVPGTPGMAANTLAAEDVGEMHFDADTHSLVFDGAGGIGINWDQVYEWQPALQSYDCQWCKKVFDNAHSLGGHLGHCKAKLKEG